MHEAYAEHGINPNTWEVHYAPQRYGAIPGDSRMRTCGSPTQARRTVRKLARKCGLPRLFFDVVGPQERLARAVGRPLETR